MEAGPRRATRIVGQVFRVLQEAGSVKMQDVQSTASQLIHLPFSVGQPIDAPAHAERAVDVFLGIYSAGNT